MKILIVGSKGNMGRRYVAICKYLGQEVLRCDLHNEKEIYDNAEFKADRCIIATPIDSHIKWCEWCVKHSIPFLCEKPISKDVSEIRKLKELCDQAKIDGRMVSNWRFLIPGTVATRVGKIFLDYYNTGKDGFWDLIQPVYLCDEFVFYNTSAIYTCTLCNNDYGMDRKSGIVIFS